MNNKIAVIYIDDTQIIGSIVRKEFGMSFKTIYSVKKEYSGIIDSDFADREEFSSTLSQVIIELGKFSTKLPDILYIGIPNEFCSVETQENEIEFDRVTKINKNHIKMLWEGIKFETEYKEIISKKSLFFKVEEFDEVMLDVIGMSTSNLKMASSAILLTNEFRPLINLYDVNTAGFSDIQLISIAECELFMIPEEQRDAGCSMVRCDFFSTSVANVIGDGLTQLSHFDMGQGYIINEIVESFSIDYDVAIELLKICKPTIEVSLDEVYTAKGQSLPAGIFNDFIKKRIHEFGNRLANVDMAKVVYISGGNINQVYGVRNMLSNACNRRMYDCRDTLTMQNSYPENTVNAMIRFIISKY